MWIRAAKKRIPVLALAVITWYQKHMGHVDRVDKNVALSRLRLKRCMKRYHRAIFLWYLAIILNNMMVLCSLLCEDYTELERAKEASGVSNEFTHTCTYIHTHIHIRIRTII